MTDATFFVVCSLWKYLKIYFVQFASYDFTPIIFFVQNRIWNIFIHGNIEWKSILTRQEINVFLERIDPEVDPEDEIDMSTEKHGPGPDEEKWSIVMI